MREPHFRVFFWIFLTAVIGTTKSVEVHFENKDGGFFLRHTPKQHIQTIPDLSSVLPSTSTPSSILSVDRFTVFQSSQPISIRATYGPFSTKQTVPARYIVPDPLDSIPIPEHNASATTVDLQELVTHHLDMSAHIVRSEIPRDSPVLRVLFHTGSDPGGRRQMLMNRHQRVCIVLHANLQNERRNALSAACSPEGEDGVCLAQITIPANWWPELPPPDKNGRPGKPIKTPPRLVQVAYSILEPRPAEGEGCAPRLQLQPVTVLGVVPLVPAGAAYKELRLGEIITMLVPHPPLFPLSRMHVPVFMERERSRDLTAIVIRARVKSGVRILSATPSTDRWNITVDINPKHTGASVTALRREPQEPEQESTAGQGDVAELFSWLIEVTEDAAEIYDGARIVWSTRFEPHAPEPLRTDAHRNHPHNSADTRKPATRLEVQKDDIQAVVPISKNWEVMNTAVLTGRQVSQAMKVFIVSQAGKAADVTLQSSCHSEDESVLKVSSSCSSVYVDGSEARGSVNGSVLVKYGTYIGLARFTVWMPEFPLDLSVPDVRLSQIKGWKVPDYHAGIGKARKKRNTFEKDEQILQKTEYLDNELPEGLGEEIFEEKSNWRVKRFDMIPDILEVTNDDSDLDWRVKRSNISPDNLQKRTSQGELKDSEKKSNFQDPDVYWRVKRSDMIPDILEKVTNDNPDINWRVKRSPEKTRHETEESSFNNGENWRVKRSDMIPDILEKVTNDNPDLNWRVKRSDTSAKTRHETEESAFNNPENWRVKRSDMIPDILEKVTNEDDLKVRQKRSIFEDNQDENSPKWRVKRSQGNQDKDDLKIKQDDLKWRVKRSDIYTEEESDLRAQIKRSISPKMDENTRSKRSYWSPNIPEEFTNGVNERPPCRVRFQQSPVDVYAHFMATDHDSGRVTYFVNRRTWLRVTDLVLPLLRVSDPKIASLHGRILQGRFNGRAEVQVLSPITGRVIGAKEVRVSNDKVTINKLAVRVVSGLQLNISPDSSIENGYIAETSVTRRLTAQYQEGLLDIELEFSDGHKTPLRDIADSDYHLVVKSLDTEVVAFAPMVASHHPRVIAVGEGRGDLLQVQLLLNEDCRMPTRSKITSSTQKPLATAAAAVEVDFSVSDVPHRPDFVQNDGGMPMKDENHHEPTVQARQHHSLQNSALNNHGRGVTRYHHYEPVNMTPLEIGMYVLLAAFCFAIVVFVVSCIVYASKFKPQGMDAQLGNSNGNAALPLNARANVNIGNSLGIMREPRKPRESTTNAHDWVWLGRATLERGSGQVLSNRSSTVNNNNGAEMRITANPMNLNYSEPDDCIVQATSFDNPNHIELPSRTVDTKTYSKRDKNINGLSNGNINNNVQRNINNQDWQDTPPPLPPHGIPLQEDYKPPVPPHRNIGVTARSSGRSGSPSLGPIARPSSPMMTPPPRRHQRTRSSSSQDREKVLVPREFEFDDAPTSGGQEGVNEGFVLNDGNRNVRGNSPEVKRATIIGNPMFSTNNEVNKTTEPGTTPADMPGLDDLQLDMDYDQIMHYFENLKESNA